MKKHFLLCFLLVSFIYLELVFKIINGVSIFVLNTIFLFTATCGFVALLYLLINLFKTKGKIIFSSIILLIFGIYFSAHTCLYRMYKFYFQLSSLSMADQVAAFASDGLKVVTNNILYILLFLLPFLLFVIWLRKYVDDRKIDYRLILIVLVASLIIYLPSALLPFGQTNIAFNTNNMIQIVNKNGVVSGLFYDIKATLFNNATSNLQQEEIIEEIEEPVEIVYDYNNLDIDFKSLNEFTDNDAIKELNDYFASKTGTKQNEYTNYFKDKNLILFMAESFNGICINPDLTPTLYKLAHNGFEFNNFYSPTIYSTIGGEFCELTSLYPDLDALAYFRRGDRQYPLGLANVFKDKGYQAYAYHDSTYDFQDRNVYLKSLGFDNYNACGLGLEKEMSCAHWPASDVDMINATFDDYANNDKFIVFYASVSGHGPYVFNEEDNIIAPKYEQQLKEYYQDRLGNGVDASLLMAYEAGQMELDKALETLINKLKAINKLDDTVIALVGDHHPYYLTETISMNAYNKLSTYERDEHIELYHSNFILYNSAMDTVRIDKVGSQLDVIPTLYNLFGINYDSRLLMGTDLLSSSTSIAIMADDSWINDKGRYYANRGEFVPIDKDVSGVYVDSINTKVKNIEKVSKSIIKNDYYKFVFDNR